MPAAGSRPASAQDLALKAPADVIAQAVSAQAFLSQFSGLFRVTTALDLQQIPQKTRDAYPHLLYNGGVVQSTMRWAKWQGVERLDVEHDVPEAVMRYENEDEIAVADGETLTRYFPRTRQASIGRRTALPTRTPADWLLPQFRMTFAEMRGDPGVQMDVRVEPGGAAVTLRKQLTPDRTMTVECTLSEAWDYAVVAWTCAELGCFVNIDYRRADGGRVLPARAVRRIFGANESKALREETLLVESWSFAPQEAEALRFKFKPGMLIGDHRPAAGERGKAYEVDEGGVLRQILVAAPGSSNWLRNMGLVALAVLLVAAVLIIRLRAVLTGGTSL